MIDRLRMLTQEEVAEALNANLSTITNLRELGILPAIKTGRNYMFSQDVIKKFQSDYSGLDVSNRVKAIRSMTIVKSRFEK